jgi:response regulator RpfG family c-di-GMP phosphodiesterase
MNSPHPIYILVVEDEPDVANAVAASLASVEDNFPIEIANSAEEAADVVKEKSDAGAELGLVLCDHVLPGKQGVDFLVSLQADAATRRARKVLLTGQAGLQATVQAVNEAGLDHYISKPWKNDELVAVTRRLLTDYVIETRDDLIPFFHSLESERLAEAMRLRGQGD